MTPRPATLAEVAERSESIEDFGRQLRDWLHEIRRFSSRAQANASVAERPRILRNRFADGAAADAWLGAYAEFLSQCTDAVPPRWAFGRDRVSPDPWFPAGSDSPRLRISALRQAPLAFKRRNLYTPFVELPLRLRAGHPVKTAEEKRQTNAQRQRRFRERQKEELAALRKLLMTEGHRKLGRSTSEKP